ncbi:3-oxoacyl-[acyl-carrier-protein] reductase [Microbacterium sp. AG157]|uniref:Beta-ketoacyl-ACP reductase n=1 Tax=Microbacterium testaceum TaxID=2033 RepID=A0A4Y3QHV3_MICTE|nr:MULTISPECIES: 3-oxoacyl-ACP reductase FabG [Microbacterium]REC99675.1 3-oxoacyl-[acyl-carrier-protein] reductase [Microbacterium sp. AG157]GEB44263.1 beta-ketoacyl-ACP reductase [Microbacterium testaceum]
MQDARVCVTGATRGIGLAIAERFLADGASVAVNYRSDRPETLAVLDRLEKEHPGRVLPVRADISSFDEVKRMFQQIRAAWGGLDVQVNNAGHAQDSFALMMSEDAWRSVVDTDLSGTFACAKQAAWLMAAQRSGTIVNISSVSAITSPAGQANYAAAKAGVVAFSRTLAKELARMNIRVNVIAPGFVETEMLDQLPSAMKDEYLALIPDRRFGSAEEIANAVFFLASPAASYINGHCLVVDGGLTA